MFCWERRQHLQPGFSRENTTPYHPVFSWERRQHFTTRVLLGEKTTPTTRVLQREHNTYNLGSPERKQHLTTRISPDRTQHFTTRVLLGEKTTLYNPCSPGREDNTLQPVFSLERRQHITTRVLLGEKTTHYNPGSPERTQHFRTRVLLTEHNTLQPGLSSERTQHLTTPGSQNTTHYQWSGKKHCISIKIECQRNDRIRKLHAEHALEYDTYMFL